MDIKLNTAGLRFLEEAAMKAAILTADVLLDAVRDAQVMPFDVGTMQNDDSYTEETEQGARLVTQGAKVRRLYFHPEYDFQKVNNPNARGEWLQPWIDGEHKDFAQETFIQIYKKETGL